MVGIAVCGLLPLSDNINCMGLNPSISGQACAFANEAMHTMQMDKIIFFNLVKFIRGLRKLRNCSEVLDCIFERAALIAPISFLYQTAFFYFDF